MAATHLTISIWVKGELATTKGLGVQAFQSCDEDVLSTMAGDATKHKQGIISKNMSYVEHKNMSEKWNDKGNS